MYYTCSNMVEVAYIFTKAVSFHFVKSRTLYLYFKFSMHLKVHKFLHVMQDFGLNDTHVLRQLAEGW